MTTDNEKKVKRAQQDQQQLAKDLYMAVHMSTYQDTLDEVKSLLQCGADPGHPIYWTKEWAEAAWRMHPPLNLICSHGSIEMAKELVEHGAPVNKGDLTVGSTPVHNVCMRDHRELAEYLIKEAGGSIYVMDKFNRAPIHQASGCGQKNMVQFLVEECGCDMELKNGKGQTALDIALSNGAHNNEGLYHVARYLMLRGSGGKEHKIKMLFAACMWGKLDVVRELIEQHKVDPHEARDKCRRTVLHSACWRGSLDVVKYLVEELGCDVEVGDHMQKTPLNIALLPGGLWELESCAETAYYLINLGYGGNDEKTTFVRGVCRRWPGKLHIIKEMVEKHSIDPKNMRDSCLMTPLHWACFRGARNTKPVVQYLVEELHCDVDAVNNKGETPCDVASYWGQNELVDYFTSQKQLEK